MRTTMIIGLILLVLGVAALGAIVGLGGVYLNLKGREEEGIVAVEEAEAIRGALVRGLSGLSDPEWMAIGARIDRQLASRQRTRYVAISCGRTARRWSRRMGQNTSTAASTITARMISAAPGRTRPVRAIKRTPKPARTATMASDIGFELTGVA